MVGYRTIPTKDAMDVDEEGGEGKAAAGAKKASSAVRPPPGGGSAASRHRAELASLAERDPEFYEYLKARPYIEPLPPSRHLGLPVIWRRLDGCG